MKTPLVVLAFSAMIPLLSACQSAATTPNPTTTNPGLSQDRAGKADEKGPTTKDQNPTKPVGTP